ncbi:NAD(P)-dependent oxidoreductase [Streptomyces sp. NPDC001674]|uniref:NAD(P)-dependent oxidoreductase n=1 Tax=Streptomyces sp. NPDC001674 TaxID=3154394 RepID=UPI003316BF6A
MARVLMVDPIHPEALADLRGRYQVALHPRPTPDQLLSYARTADALVLRAGVRVTEEVIEAAPRLRAVIRAGVGLDNIDLEAAARAGVEVRNVPGGSSDAVAELALGLMLAVCRRIVVGDRHTRSTVWHKQGLLGTELRGKTLGLIGFGGIGSRIATLAQGFGMDVVVAVARPGEDRARELAARGIRLASLDGLLPAADVVCLSVPLTAGTRNLIGRRELALMRPQAYLVNVSRGGTVDEEALLEALRRGELAGAATDVLAREGAPTALAALDNVVLTPHIGALTREAQRRIGQRVVELLDTALAPLERLRLTA